MKKFLKITLLLLLLTVIGYFGYRHFKKTSVLLDVIHNDAESVVKIGIHDITKTLVLDALTSPSYYWNNSESSKETKKDTTEEDNIGVNLKPFSLVFYTIKNIENTFFGTLNIDDSESFEKFVQSYSVKKSSPIIVDEKDYKYLIIEKSKHIIAWNTKKVAIAFSPEVNIKKVRTIFEDVLLDNKLISDKNHPIIKALSSDTNHIVYKNGQSTVSLNFKDQKAIIDGIIYTKNTNVYKFKTINNKSLSDASLKLYLDTNFSNPKNKTTFIKNLSGISFFQKNNIDITDFSNKTDGIFNVAVKGKTTQLDTVVSYEYDDNFEKIAVKALQKKQAPQIFIDIGKKSESLYDYLNTQQTIKDSVLTAIPFYTFYAKEDNLSTTFSTTKEIPVTKTLSNTSFFDLEINFNDLKNDLEIPQVNEIFSLLKTFKLEATQIENSNQIKVNGIIEGNNESINIVSQLFFKLQNKK